MAWKKVYQNRLKKLADHLMTGKLGHEKFNFELLNVDSNNKDLPYKCGTSGCALGECPIIFRSWEFEKTGFPVLKNRFFTVQTSANIFFGVDDDESNHLFYPSIQTIENYGGKKLYGNATRKQVARNIYAFIKIKAKKEIT